MLNKFTLVKSLVALIVTAFFLFGCGGNRSDSKATITFSVDDVLAAQKKAKNSNDIKEISVTDLEGNEIGTAKEVEPRKFEVEVDKDIDIDIKVTLINSNNGEVILERIIEGTKSEDTTVDQDSTHVATYVRDSASENNQEIKHYLEEHKGDLEKIKALLKEIADKDYLNRLLEANNTQDLEQLTQTIAEALKELERVNALLERLQTRIENFQNGSSDIESGDEGEHNLTLEHVADQIESHDSENNDSSVEIGANGEIVVVNNEGVKNVTTDANIQKEPIVSGEVISSNDDVIVIGTKSETGNKEVSIFNNKLVEYITVLLNNIHPGDHVIVKYEENEDGKKIIAKISGSGTTVGLVAEIKEKGLIISDEHNYVTEFTARYLTEKSIFDPEVLAFLAKLKVNDKVKIKWEINERKRIIAIAKITETIEEPIKPEEPGTEEPTTEVPVPEVPAEPTTFTFTGQVIEKNDLGFRLQNGANTESIFININNDIAYHKEILTSLLTGDVITVIAHKGDNKYILNEASGYGEMFGTLIEKSETEKYVKNSDGKTVKFMPEWHDGGLDAGMLTKFKELAVGASISVKWKLEERKRAVSISLN